MSINKYSKMDYFVGLTFHNINYEQLYDTLFYLTMEERDKIYDYDLQSTVSFNSLPNFQ